MKLHVFQLALAFLVLVSYCTAAIQFGPGVDYAATLRQAVEKANEAFGRRNVVAVSAWQYGSPLYGSIRTQLLNTKGKYAYLGRVDHFDIFGTNWAGRMPGKSRDSEHVFLFAMNRMTHKYEPIGFANYESSGLAHAALDFRQHSQGLDLSRNFNQMREYRGFPPGSLESAAAA